VTKYFPLVDCQFKARSPANTKEDYSSRTLIDHKSEIVLTLSNYIWVRECTSRGEVPTLCTPDHFTVTFKLASTTFKGNKPDTERFYFDFHGATYILSDFVQVMKSDQFAQYINEVAARLALDTNKPVGGDYLPAPVSGDWFADMQGSQPVIDIEYEERLQRGEVLDEVVEDEEEEQPVLPPAPVVVKSSSSRKKKH